MVKLSKEILTKIEVQEDNYLRCSEKCPHIILKEFDIEDGTCSFFDKEVYDRDDVDREFKKLIRCDECIRMFGGATLQEKAVLIKEEEKIQDEEKTREGDYILRPYLEDSIIKLITNNNLSRGQHKRKYKIENITAEIKELTENYFEYVFMVVLNRPMKKSYWHRSCYETHLEKTISIDKNTADKMFKIELEPITLNMLRDSNPSLPSNSLIERDIF